MTRHSGPPPIIPRTHISDRARAWRFASLVLAASVVMTMIEATARPDERVASLLTGLFPMIGSPIAWKYGARLTPNRQKCCLLSWKVLQSAVHSPVDGDGKQGN